MTDQIKTLPKAELHVHIEGTIAPDVYQRIAARNGKSIPEGFVLPDGKGYRWGDFVEFLDAYDRVADCLKTPEDYAEITHDYLIRSAAEGVIYTEFIISPDHADLIGLGFDGMLDGINAGADRAEKETGIIARLNVTAVRHFDHAQSIRAAELAAKAAGGNRRVVGFGLAGNEIDFPARDFARAFDIAREAGLGLHCHAGEAAGPESIIEALDILKVQRIGHGVRAIEDPKLMQRLAAERIPLEVCPSSNIATQVFPSMKDHSLPKLVKAGIPCTLSSDDPPFFNCTPGGEYRIAHEVMGMKRSELLDMTRAAIDHAFCDAATRARLEARYKAMLGSDTPKPPL
ncbi:MAG: adenosine deaminase [Alphaproteobacteria bacterium]